METIGTTAAAVLGLGAWAVLEGSTGEATKDAYKALRQMIGSWAASDVAVLELQPTSAARQAALAEAIDARAPDEQARALELARQLVRQLRRDAGSPSVGFDFARLDALAVSLGQIVVTEGIGARIGGVAVQGSVNIGGFVTGSGNVIISQGSSVGIEPVEPWPDPTKPNR